MEQLSKKRSNTDTLENWIDEAVMSFVIDMKYKLRLNNHKGHWKLVGHNELMARMVAEVAELQEEFNESDGSEKSHMAIIHECADIANFAMMIADNSKRMMRRPSFSHEE